MVEILKLEEIYGPQSWPFIVIIICTISATILAIITSYSENVNTGTGIIIIIIFTIIITIFIFLITGTFDEYKYTKYTIKIPSNVSFEEIDTKYDILKHYEYSNVYEVKEK